MPPAREASSRLAFRSPHVVALAGVMVLGGVLRFATLDLQSYRYDEAVTVVRVLHPSLFDTLSAVKGESTPPLYYVVAWIWSRILGTGDVGLRSLSALAGTASILVVYLAGIALRLPRRTALVAAAIVAVNPVLIWFSQDARSYALAFLLTSLSFLYFARALRCPRGRNMALWTTFSALAIATHYFAVFAVAPELVLLLLQPSLVRLARRAGAVIAVVGLLLAPLALHQIENAHAAWIPREPLSSRMERAGAKLVGDDNGDEHGRRQPGPLPLVMPAALALIALALLLMVGTKDERRVAFPAAAVALGALCLPLILALLGSDFFDGRNMVPVFAPPILVLAAGFGVRRVGLAGSGLAVLFCLFSLVFTLEIDRLPRLQRENLRNAARIAGPLRHDTVVVTSRYSASMPLRYYLGAAVARGPLPLLRQIDLIGSAANTEQAHILPPAFRRVTSRPVSYDFTLTVFRSRRPMRVPLSLLSNGALVGGGGRSSVLILPPFPRDAAGSSQDSAASFGGGTAAGH